MSKKKKGQKHNIWLMIAGFIVDRRKLIGLIFLAAVIYSIFSISKVHVNQDIKSYLPTESETRAGLELMDEEFTTPGTAQVMISNVTYEEAAGLAEKIQKVDGVTSVAFDNSESSYRGTNALLTVMVDGGSEDESSIAAKARIKELLKGYDAYISSEIGYSQEMQDMLTTEMTGILVWAIIVVIGVMLVSTKAYMLIPVLFLTFGVAVILNMGTNYWFGEISFITNSIAIVLQLALSIDYAIILSDRFMEEYERMDVTNAAKVALSKAIPEISASSLTTVSGMIAMMFMQFRLGYDMGIVLVKAILFSLISVFLLMPGILVFFADKIEKTRHKNLIPDVSVIGRYAVKTRKVIPPIFIVIVILACIGTAMCPFLYDVNSVEGSKKNEATIAREHIEAVFGKSNQLVVIVPKGDYEAEKKVLEQIEQVDGVSFAMGLANQEISDGIMLTDKMTPRQFAELTDLDLEIIEALYGFYAYDQEQYGPLVTDIDSYGVPMIDMFMFLYDQYQQGYVKLDEEMDEMLNSMYDMLSMAQDQLMGKNYNRFILNLSLPTEGQETYDVMDEISGIAEAYYGEGNVTLVGNATVCRDLETTFATDNLIISGLTALFVLVVLLFTFRSAGLSILLVLTIQGAIWISFSIPTIMGQGVYFIGYLIVCAIQMGATIDYAIVIANRYIQLKKEMSKEEAVRTAVNQAFPTVFTSGTIMISAGFLVGYMTSDVTISVFGVTIGRGATISVLMVLLVLPQILLFGDKFIEKTRFSVSLKSLFGSGKAEKAAAVTTWDMGGDQEQKQEKPDDAAADFKAKKKKKDKKKGKRKNDRNSEGGADNE